MFKVELDSHEFLMGCFRMSVAFPAPAPLRHGRSVMWVPVREKNKPDNNCLLFLLKEEKHGRITSKRNKTAGELRPFVDALECLLERWGTSWVDHHKADNCGQLTTHVLQMVCGRRCWCMWWWVWYLLHHSAVKNGQNPMLSPSECFSEAQDSVFRLTGVFIWLYDRKWNKSSFHPTWNQKMG